MNKKPKGGGKKNRMGVGHLRTSLVTCLIHLGSYPPNEYGAFVGKVSIAIVGRSRVDRVEMYVCIVVPDTPQRSLETTEQLCGAGAATAEIAGGTAIHLG
jgi:hypothetical protein